MVQWVEIQGTFQVNLLKQKWRATAQMYGMWSIALGQKCRGWAQNWANLFSKSGDEWHIWFPRCRVDPAVRGLFLDSHPLSPLLTYRTYRNGSRDTQQGQSRSTRTPKCRQCKQITLGFLNGTCHFLFKKYCSLFLNGMV